MTAKSLLRCYGSTGMAVGSAEATQAGHAGSGTQWYSTAPLKPARAACGDRGWTPQLEAAWGLLPLQLGCEKGAQQQQPDLTFDAVREACALQALEPELVARGPLPGDVVRRILALASPVYGLTARAHTPLRRCGRT